MERILVVEDDPALLRGLVDNLRCESYDVVSATDGELACRMIRSAHPDLVVLDLTLPRLDGVEVCRRMRGEGVRTPIVMLTSRSEESDRVRGLEVGADDYVSKPFSLPELFARIRSILRHRRDWLTETSELRHDLRSAADVQRRLFPHVRPPMTGLDYAGVCRPARVIGGDYFDYFEVGPSRLGLLVADVSGKGASAALLMATLQGCVRSSAPALGDRCDAVIGQANLVLCATTDASRYATMFYAVFDADSRWLTYVNAGHVSALLFSSHADGVVELESHGPPVGMFENLPFVAHRRRLEADTWLLVFSDGVSEAANAADEQFGREGLHQVVRRCRDRSASELCEAVLAAVDEHSAGQVQADDLTVVAARVH